jgi:hypothetical protein
VDVLDANKLLTASRSDAYRVRQDAAQITRIFGDALSVCESSLGIAKSPQGQRPIGQK